MKPQVPILTMLAFLTAPSADAGCCQNAVAVVRSLTGHASVQPAGGDITSLSAFDWLEDKSRIEVKTGAMVIILRNGFTYEFRDGFRGTVTAAAVTNTRGPVRRLESLPPIPTPTPLADATLRTGGALRIRGDRVRDLYPNESAATLPDAITLTFRAVPHARSYTVELRNAAEKVLFREETNVTRIVVPRGLLQPDQVYSWQVQATASARIIATGIASFRTLSAQALQARAEFAKALPASLGERQALLADVDLRLGLISEAVDGFRAALRLQPGDHSIQRALHRAERSRNPVLETQ